MPIGTEYPGKLEWTFPLPRTHTGIYLGNGVQGLMIWGRESLHVTVGRSGFWDHRGASELIANTTYRELRRLLEAGDEEALRRLYHSGERRDDEPDRPIQIGCGRLELSFGDGMGPRAATLDLERGVVTVRVADAAGERQGEVHIHQAMGSEIAWLEMTPPLLAGTTVGVVPAWDYVHEKLQAWGYAPPERWDEADAGGMCQATPEDAALALAWRKRDGDLVLATVLLDTAAEAIDAAQRAAEEADLPTLEAAGKAWWDAYWRDVPTLSLPDPVLTEAWLYGLHKQAGMTTPGGVAATLQGPWLEEYQLPPWSSDYHFNINIEMIYWPCLSTNRLSHLGPLWDMLMKWVPTMRENAEAFFEAEDALMLPHAVDDRCNVEGSFWTGTIDHACTAWMAQLAWMHYRYGMDRQVLEHVAWPLLVGAFNGYWGMLEEVKRDGETALSLPVSVSPEYGGANIDAWGRDASFQLAALHFLADALPKAARALGKPEDPRWQTVRERVPPYTTIEGDTGLRPGMLRRIALWEGQDLEESHRHHSHLGGIYPFCTVDPQDPTHKDVVAASLHQWIRKGMGAWTGWCMPWASMILSRLSFADAAVALLHWWNDIYTNVGRGTNHNASINGITLFDNGYFPQALGGREAPGPEVMQMDAAMGVVTAVTELLVQTRGDVVTVLPAIPMRWRELSFDGIRTEGAFLVGATVTEGRLQEVRVRSLVGGSIRLAHTPETHWALPSGDTAMGTITVDTRAGETLAFGIA